MATSVHIPPPLLAKVDRRAKEAGVSRNRFIVQTLEREVSRDRGWPPGFLDRFRAVDPETQTAVDDMLAAIKRNRRSRKRPPRL